MMENSNDTEDILILVEHATGQQGIHELEISFDGETGFQRRFKNCKKNPGHKKFFPLDGLKINDLPQHVSNPETLLIIHQLAAGTVKLTLNFISKKRPSTLPFAQLAGKRVFTFGSGYVTEISKSEDKKEFKCPFTDCQEQPGPHSVYGYITVVTAAHLVCNDEEAENITVEFFYDSSEDKGGVRKARGLRLGAVCHEGDFCELVCVTHDVLLFEKAHCVSVPSYLLPPEIMKTKFTESFENDFNKMKHFSLRCTCNSKTVRAQSKESVTLTNIRDLMNLKSEMSSERKTVIQLMKAFSLSCRYFNRDISFDIHFISKLFELKFPALGSLDGGDTIIFYLPPHSNPGQLLLLLLWDVPAIRKAIYKYLEISCPPNLLEHLIPAFFKVIFNYNKTVQSSYTVLLEIINYLPTIRDIETSLRENFIRKHPTSIFELNLQLSKHNIPSFSRLRFWDVDDNGVTTLTVTFHDQDPELYLLQEPTSAEFTTSYRCPGCRLIICVCPILGQSRLDLRNTRFHKIPASYMSRHVKTLQLKTEMEKYSGIKNDIKYWFFNKTDEYFGFTKVFEDWCLKNADTIDTMRQEKMSLVKEVGVNSLVIHISHPHGQSKHVTFGELTECLTGDGHYHPLYTADTCPGSSGGPTWVISWDDPKETYGFTHSGYIGNKPNKGSAWTLYPRADIFTGSDYRDKLRLTENIYFLLRSVSSPPKSIFEYI